VFTVNAAIIIGPMAFQRPHNYTSVRLYSITYVVYTK